MTIIYIGTDHRTTTYTVRPSESMHQAIIDRCPKGQVPTHADCIGTLVYVQTTSDRP